MGVHLPTNYFVRNADLHAQTMTGHHKKLQLYKGIPLAGYEDKFYAQMREGKLIDGIVKGSP